MLVRTRGIITRRGMFSFWGYAPPLAVVPTHRASVLVAFSGDGRNAYKQKGGKGNETPAARYSIDSAAEGRRRRTGKWRYAGSNGGFIMNPVRPPKSALLGPQAARRKCIIDVVHVLTSPNPR